MQYYIFHDIILMFEMKCYFFNKEEVFVMACKDCNKNAKLYEELDALIKEHEGNRDSLIPVMQGAQEIFGYLPKDVQILIAQGLGIKLSDVYGVATFYSQFTLEPQGEYVISVCLGTACYVKGSQKILDELSKELKVQEGKTTPDGKFTLNATRCLGACGLAPVMMINDEVYGRLTPDMISGIIKKYEDK